MNNEQYKRELRTAYQMGYHNRVKVFFLQVIGFSIAVLLAWISFNFVVDKFNSKFGKFDSVKYVPIPCEEQSEKPLPTGKIEIDPNQVQLL